MSKILDRSGRPMKPTQRYHIRQRAAEQTGSMRGWNPHETGKWVQDADRLDIVRRSIDLYQSDSVASGMVDKLTIEVVGPGLKPIPTYNKGTKNQSRNIRKQMKEIWFKADRYLDIREMVSFGGLQALNWRTFSVYGESFTVVHRIDEPLRPYSVSLQDVNPMRVKTPSDKVSDENIIDGIEMDKYGRPAYYWIKKSGDQLSDTSDNFVRMPRTVNGRPKVLHFFIPRMVEQMRGYPMFTSALQTFADRGVYTNAELTSATVTAALAYFIETPNRDPYEAAMDASDDYSYDYDADGAAITRYHQSFAPGQIMYGNAGEKPHMMNANRPGTSFEPFIKSIKKELANSVYSMPYSSMFNDAEGINYAGFRSMSLAAWKIILYFRSCLAFELQKIYTLLMEEAYLLGELEIPFYDDPYGLTKANWYGSAKGDIEPVKEAEADIKLIDKRLKTRGEARLERATNYGDDIYEVFDQIEEEEEELAKRNLQEVVNEPTQSPNTDTEDD